MMSVRTESRYLGKGYHLSDGLVRLSFKSELCYCTRGQLGLNVP